MKPFNFSTFSRLKPGSYYTFEWDEGRELLARIASEEMLALSLGAKNFSFSHRICKELDVTEAGIAYVTEAEIAFNYDTGDAGTQGEITILFEFMRKVDKRDVVTVINRVCQLPKTFIERVKFLFLPPQYTLSTASYEPNGHLSAYFADWARDEDLEGIRECVERVTGRCLDPFGMV